MFEMYKGDVDLECKTSLGLFACFYMQWINAG